jgi:ectoine hydroxylase-related dioxygenase (phytanoyl-CoA dioxygenase family)
LQLTAQLLERGFAIVASCIAERDVQRLDDLAVEPAPGVRNLLEHDAIRELARSPQIRNLIVPVLGESCFAVRGILFNKSADANWKVSWHQDRVIALKERRELPGWGPWSVKEGVHHVSPPSEVMERMLAVRLHLDDCGGDNGPLRVLPGSHKSGYISDDGIARMDKESAVTCTVRRSDVVLMRPLAVHASSLATRPGSRRVIHIEYTAQELPMGIEWFERV